MSTTFEPVIGLEVHAQLQTKTKLFCGCLTQFGQAPNAQVCPVCIALPGALPVLNAHAVELAVRAGLALGCEIQEVSVFERKNYFYPDLPKGYQISQFQRPYALRGGVDVPQPDGSTRFVNLVRIHMEEDAGKTSHDNSSKRSHVDYNRACVPLIEIVSEPEIRSAAEAADYLRRLRQILMALQVCDGNMEEGSFRCDANVSIRPVGQAKLGTRVELKNINSFKFVQQAIDYEIARQSEVILGGGKVVQETRLYDSDTKTTRSMRSKEEANDYRYFPDPDLPPVVLSEAYIGKVRAHLPELPHQKAARFVSQLGLPAADAALLADDAYASRFFEEALALHQNAKGLATWLLNDVARIAKQQEAGLSGFVMKPAHLAELVKLLDDQVISGKIAKDIIEEVMGGASPNELIEKKGLKQVSDTGAIEKVAQEIIAANEKSAEQVRSGNQKLFGFFVGQVMKAMHGKANPQVVNDILRALLTPKA